MSKFPEYCEIPSLQWVSIINTAANTATDGTGTVSTIWTCDSVRNGFFTASFDKTSQQYW